MLLHFTSNLPTGAFCRLPFEKFAHANDLLDLGEIACITDGERTVDS